MAAKKPAVEVHHRLIIQPDDGTQPVVELIDDATKSLRVKQFTLTDSAVMSALIRAHKRRVAVRIMLNPHRSSGDRANDESFKALRRAGLKVEWTNPAFAVTHEKSMAIDDAVALISTFNLATKYFTETRDYGIVTTNPTQVAQVTRCFDADWQRKAFTADRESGLLWSSNNARQIMAWFIDTAEKELIIQHPKFVDATIVERIAAARKRGVRVRLLCGGKHGISDWDVLDTFASLRLLDRFGVKVRRQKHLKLHAKLLIVDGDRAQVGSMNIDRSAFDLRRELGVLIDEPHIIKGLAKVFEQDWRESKGYEAPDPLQPDKHHEGELPHDPHFLHE
jgi:phosphatidylserine/phosphatidylglycerophosphate/cardiolipin synthase-like enzyme